jgi:hypothetical protein
MYFMVQACAILVPSMCAACPPFAQGVPQKKTAPYEGAELRKAGKR